MKLILTPDQIIKENNHGIILAGDWCKTFENKKLWNEEEPDVVPYHWDDRKKLYDDLMYLDELYEKILKLISISLNSIHGCNYSVRFWRIIIGPWLSQFIFSFYDRFETLKFAKNCAIIDNVKIIKNSPKDFVANDADHYIYIRSTDVYNHYLFSQIIEKTNIFNFDYLNKPDNLLRYNREKINESLKNKILSYINRFSAFLFKQKVVFISTYLNPFDLIKLQLSIFQLPYLFPPLIEIPKFEYSKKLRQKLLINCPGSDFEKLLYAVLSEHIPLVYIEGFNHTLNESLKFFPKNPKVIFTAAAYERDEAFKFWAASNIENGAKLVGTQHGFNYGAIKWFHEEEHQIKCYDKFYTWGWKSNKFSNTKVLPAAKFNHKIKNIQPDPSGHILFVTYVWPRYSYKMMTTPVSASQSYKFIESQTDIVNQLEKEVKKLVLVRPKLVKVFEEGINQLGLWQHACPDIGIYIGNEISMYDQMKKSRLLLSMVCGTAQLESFSINFPTILYWSKFHEIRDDALPVFQKLIDVGILHKSKKSLANKINEIYQDPISWWSQPEIQKAKDSFCRKFARKSDNWLNEWKKELKSLI